MIEACRIFNQSHFQYIEQKVNGYAVALAL